MYTCTHNMRRDRYAFRTDRERSVRFEWSGFFFLDLLTLVWRSPGLDKLGNVPPSLATVVGVREFLNHTDLG